MDVTIISGSESSVAKYAAQEFECFLLKYTNAGFTESADTDRYFILEIIEHDDSARFMINGDFLNGKPCVYIRGSDESSLLCGVYEALGRMGLSFYADGERLRGSFDITACDRADEAITPLCRHRGVRQHINFPMDISSYRLRDAQEYIKNLARMRMNSITFHSYTGQWHGYQTDKKSVLAGHFFYGYRYDVPTKYAQYIDNDQYFCIPEIEPLLLNETERAAFAQKWLRKLTITAKEAGMHVTVSIELPPEEDIDILVEIVRNVLRAYPEIDAIEWISPEGGGVGKKFGYDQLEEKVSEYFGNRSLTLARSALPKSMPEFLPGAMQSLKRAYDLYQLKGRIFEGLEPKEIYVGLYVFCRDTLKFLKQIIVDLFPPEVILTFLPAHGSSAAAENIEYMNFTAEELQRSMIYSWIEFDGNMYLQQNSSKGIARLFNHLSEKSSGGSVFGACFNHWRTAENEVVIAYMAEAAIKPLKTKSFYGKYAYNNEVTNAGTFCDALLLLEDIDCFNRDRLFNIGFCSLECWIGGPGLEWIRKHGLTPGGFSSEIIHESVEMYRRAAALLERCLVETLSSNGIRLLRFLLNRVGCSVSQLLAVNELALLCPFTDDEHPEKLTEEQRQAVSQGCDKADAYCEQYVNAHFRMMEDRGCEGTAVSYMATMPVYVDHIRQYFVYGETECCAHKPDSFDKPPAPDNAYL